jgi:hypothetical protein
MKRKGPSVIYDIISTGHRSHSGDRTQTAPTHTSYVTRTHTGHTCNETKQQRRPTTRVPRPTPLADTNIKCKQNYRLQCATEHKRDADNLNLKLVKYEDRRCARIVRAYRMIVPSHTLRLWTGDGSHGFATCTPLHLSRLPVPLARALPRSCILLYATLQGLRFTDTMPKHPVLRRPHQHHSRTLGDPPPLPGVL